MISLQFQIVSISLCYQWLKLYNDRESIMKWYVVSLLLQDGPAYVHLFVTILRDIFKEETVEYVLALIYEMLSGN